MKNKALLIGAIVATFVLVTVVISYLLIVVAGSPRDASTQPVSAAPYTPQQYANQANKYTLSLFSPGLPWAVVDHGDEVKFTRSDRVTLHVKVERLADAAGTNFLDKRKQLSVEGATVNRRIPVSGQGWKGELIQVTPSDPISGKKGRNRVNVYLQHGATVSEWNLFDEDIENLNDVEISAFVDKTLPSLKFQ